MSRRDLRTDHAFAACEAKGGCISYGSAKRKFSVENSTHGVNFFEFTSRRRFEKRFSGNACLQRVAASVFPDRDGAPVSGMNDFGFAQILDRLLEVDDLEWIWATGRSDDGLRNLVDPDPYQGLPVKDAPQMPQGFASQMQLAIYLIRVDLRLVLTKGAHRARFFGLLDHLPCDGVAVYVVPLKRNGFKMKLPPVGIR